MSVGIRNTSFNKPLVKNNHIKQPVLTLNRNNGSGRITVYLKKSIEGIEEYLSSKFNEVGTVLREQHDSILTKFSRSSKSHSITNSYHQCDKLLFKTETNFTKLFDMPSGTTNTQDCQKYIFTNLKSQHLFKQIRSFKTESPTDMRHKNQRSRFLEFLGIKQKPTNFRIRDDLENFQQNLSKEHLNPEQNQKALLSYAEGYMQAMEYIFTRKSWTANMYRVVVLVGLTGIFAYAISQISIEVSGNMINVEESKSEVKFSDVKGADEAKEELQNVVEFLKNPDKFSALGGKLPKGVLLVGPPGTGKTLLAKAVAGEAGVPFFSTSGPEFDEVFVGMGARRIRELFKLAKESVPCVIFIDEIDSIGKERTSSSLHPYANDTINQLLSEMDGFRNTKGIIVLGATNRRKDLDKALLRPGRFDVEVNVQVPDYRGRKELLEFYLRKVRHQGVDVDRLARGTINFTGADIENLVNQAALRAAVLGAPHVSMGHLEHARDKALMGPESLSRIVDEETNRITAYHEAGHTVVSFFTEHSQPLHKVTIIARGSSLGHTSYIPDKDVYHVTKSQLLAMIDSMMGGRAAEELVFGEERITSGAQSDLQKATDLAAKMVSRWGMSEAAGLPSYSDYNQISPMAADLIDREVKKILSESYERAKRVLRQYRREHKALSEALLKHETLDADQIKRILENLTID